MTRPTIADVQRAVAEAYAVPVEDLLDHRRDAKLAHPRQIAMYLARKATRHSSVVIGRHFRRDHSTVLYAVQKVERKTRDTVLTRLAVRAIRQKLWRQG